MTVLVVLTLIVIVALIAGLAVYLYWAGTLLDRVGAKLGGAAEIVHGSEADAGLIMPGVDHINRTGGVVAGALPLLYTMAEGIVTGVTPRVPEPAVPEPARPASGSAPVHGEWKRRAGEEPAGSVRAKAFSSSAFDPGRAG